MIHFSKAMLRLFWR